MKLHLTLIFMVCMMTLSASSSLGAITAVQQPQAKRHFKDGFKDNYSGRKYNYEGKTKVPSKSSEQGENAEYSEDKPYVKEEQTTDAWSFDLTAFNWLFVLILIVAVGYLAYILLNEGSSKLFSSRNKDRLTAYSEITAENIEHADITSLITKAENSNDYRLAIRYYYLLVLRQLSLNSFIKYEDDKTNADYINAIASQKFSSGFVYTSYIYNYTWYGEFALDMEQYKLAKSSFIQLLKEVNV